MTSDCPIQGLMETISKKWVLQIFKSLESGATTFSSFQKGIPGINSRILTERLVELEKHGFIKREIVSERPVKIKYSSTEKCLQILKEFNRIEAIIRSWD